MMMCQSVPLLLLVALSAVVPPTLTAAFNASTCTAQPLEDCQSRRRQLGQSLHEGRRDRDAFADVFASAGSRSNDADSAAATERQLQARVVGGSEVCPTYAYSGFLVGLVSGVYQTTASSRDATFCGGTLYGRGHVITAAHCVCHGRNGTFAANESVGLAIEVHRHDLSKALCEECGVRIAVAAVHCHADYDPISLDSDIAVLVLAENVSAAYDVDNVVLDRTGAFEAENTTLIVAGWGANNTDQSRPTFRAEALTAEVDVVSTAQCTADNWTYPSAAITDNMFCAGVRGSRAPSPSLPVLIRACATRSGLYHGMQSRLVKSVSACACEGEGHFGRTHNTTARK